MELKLSTRAYDVLSFASEESNRIGNDFIGIEHLMLGILRDTTCGAVKILKSNNISLNELKREIDAYLRDLSNSSKANISERQLANKQLERTIKYAYLLSKNLMSDVVKTEHFLLSILRDKSNIISSTLEKMGLITDNISLSNDKYEDNQNEENEIELGSDYEEAPDIYNIYEDDEYEDQHSSSRPQRGGGSSKSATPLLDSFGRDLTQMAEEGKLDPIVGREKELERIAQILSRRKKNNPILIGEPGVGKSAIAEGLAIRITQRKVPRSLFDKRVVTLDLASLVAGTKYRGQFEERMKVVLKEIENNKDIIMFIDEIHTIVGAGNASGALDASNMFKPALARGELQCIGATTLNEYRQYIEKDGALERRFQKIIVDPTTEEETEQILHNIKEKYEDHHLREI